MTINISNVDEFDAMFNALDQFIQNTEEVEDEITEAEQAQLQAARCFMVKMATVRCMSAR